MRTATIGASGHESEPVLCPHGCGTIAKLHHILSDCEHMEGLMRARHNKAQKIVVDHLLCAGWTVVVTPELNVKWTNPPQNGPREEELKPDIVAVTPDGARSLVLDVICPYESHADVLRERDHQKREKYGRPEVLEAIKAKLAEDHHLVPTKMDVYGLVFGARGAIHNVTLNLLRELGMTNSRIGSIVDTVAKASMTMYKLFENTTTCPKCVSR